MSAEVTLPPTLRHLEGHDNRKMEMVVVVPVARCEWHLGIKLLKWMRALSPEVLHNCIILGAPKLSDGEFAALREAAGGIPDEHRPKFEDKGYFSGANLMFKSALDYCERAHPGKAMLWCETDCIPLRASWFDEILDEYRWCGQYFMGDVHLHGLNHMTGNAVWSPHWRKFPSLAALPGPDPEWGFDSMCAQDTLTRAHRASTIQQIWRPPIPITAQWAAKNIKPEAALFHQVKDGSLIDLLCDQQGIPRIPLPKQLEESTYAKGRQTPEDPEMVKNLTPHQRITVGLPAKPEARSMGILIVSCLKDIEFLRYALKSIEKNARGFSEVVVAVQEDEARHFQWVKKQRLHAYKPADPSKPMLSHEVIKCRADEIMANSEMILFMDSDCMFWQPATPASFIVDGKPRLIRERYADVRNPLRRSWQKAAEKSLGFKPEYDGMVCHPNVYWRELFPALRKAIETHTGMEFDKHVVAGRNEFPQEFAEFGSMIAVALRDFRHRYHCIDYDWRADARACGLPGTAEFQYIYKKDRDPLVETWSHGGIARYKSDIEAWLRGQVPAYFLK